MNLVPPLLDVRRLTIAYPAAAGAICAVRQVSFQLEAGRTLALVGETGSGKTTLALSLAGLLDASAHIVSGEMRFDGREVTRLPEKQWRRLRGTAIGFLFQDPRSALNPVLTVGAQIIEAIRAHQAVSRATAHARALRLLQEVGVPDPGYHLRRFPMELSTGLCQRVSIALGTCNQPRLLIADEPTSALDPSLQAQVVQLLRQLKQGHRLSMLLVSHDLALVAGLADRVAVMYHGRIVETGPVDAIIHHSAHPYTRGLLACRPELRHHHRERPLPVIPGMPPAVGTVLPGCAFGPRCSLVEAACTQTMPALLAVSDSHEAACFKAGRGPTWIPS